MKLKKHKSDEYEKHHSRHDFRYTKIDQIPASTLMTIRKALAGGWIQKKSDNSRIGLQEISRMYPDISPKCIREILITYKSEIVVRDPDLIVIGGEA